jgi:hypothetical protein
MSYQQQQQQQQQQFVEAGLEQGPPLGGCRVEVQQTTAEAAAA